MSNIDKLSNEDLSKIIKKYNINTNGQNINRTQAIQLVNKYIESKNKNAGVKSISVENQKQRQRRMSATGSTQVKRENIPQNDVKHVRDRRMSQPQTHKEEQFAKRDHELKINQNLETKKAINELNEKMPQYDNVGMYPKQKRLIAIGDVHGDLSVTLIALKLAEVIDKDIFSYNFNLDKILWKGGSTWIVQTGDQIDRCRPENWKNDCIEDLDDVEADEGNNMVIIKLFKLLDDQARKQGGRVITLLGNHELMNVDRDFRYVSPKEFLEFVPQKDRTTRLTKDGLPLGYYHRLKAFERGGSISNFMLNIKKVWFKLVHGYFYMVDLVMP